MIKRLNNKNVEVAKIMQVVFQASYKIEARLLNAIDFPPLKRPLENYIECDNIFYGYFKNNNLAAVIEIIVAMEYIHIRSLVVSPKFFRQGIAKQLMEFTLNTFDSNVFVVETGVDNVPASKLYLNLGFKEVKQWDTDYGIPKVKFEFKKNID
jgi:ribosomal protein S18 acetylase RimI-like enzyme